MKNIIYSIVYIIITGNLIFAQTNNEIKYPKINIGPKIGLNFVTITDYNTNILKTINSTNGYYSPFVNQFIDTKFNIGFVADLKFSKRFAFQTEICYNQVGVINELPISVSSTSQTVNEKIYTGINYIQIPLLLKTSFGKKVCFNLLGGTSINLAISGKTDITANTKSLNGSVKTASYSSDILIGKPNGIKAFDLGLILGTGIAVKFKRNELNVDVRYNRGLIDINYDQVPSGYSQNYNSFVSISTYFTFQL